MERVRQLRDAIKNRYSKPCCIKLSVGVGVGLLVVVVVVVAATVAGGGGDEGSESESAVTTKMAATDTDHASASTAATEPSTASSSSTQPPTEPPLPQAEEWSHQFAVQLESQDYSQTLAIDDATQRYVIEVNSNQYFNIYIIVDFEKGETLPVKHHFSDISLARQVFLTCSRENLNIKQILEGLKFLKKQHVYVILEKGENDVTTTMAERNVLYCESSPFASDFNGQFASSAILREGGTTYREQVSGRTATLDATYKNTPYTVSAILVTILQGSCTAVPADRKFQWKTQLSGCGDNTTLPVDSPTCSNSPCPNFEKTSHSIQEACSSFQQCNYVMAKCDSSWTQPYDQRPYCVCRNTVIDDADNVNCPAVAAKDTAECETSKQNIQEFERAASCYCRYRIFRIYPKIIPTNVQTISWEIKATIRTAPSNRYDKCPC